MQSGSGNSPFATDTPDVQSASGCRHVAVPLILGLAAILVGVGVFCWKIDDFKQAYASSTWPTVQGQIVHSEVVWLRNQKGLVYDADITYHYAVNGQQYAGTLVSILEYQGDSHSMSEIVRGYPEGAPVTVHYDPANPAYAVLEPGLNMTLLVFGGALALFTAVGILVVSGSLRQFLGPR